MDPNSAIGLSPLEQIEIDRVHYMDPINLESLLYTYEKSKFSSLNGIADGDSVQTGFA